MIPIATPGRSVPPADPGSDAAGPSDRAVPVTVGQAATPASTAVADSGSIGIVDVPVTVPIGRSGTVGQGTQVLTGASRDLTDRARSRAEVRLAGRGRVRVPSTSSRFAGTDLGATDRSG